MHQKEVREGRRAGQQGQAGGVLAVGPHSALGRSVSAALYFHAPAIRAATQEPQIDAICVADSGYIAAISMACFVNATAAPSAE